MCNLHNADDNKMALDHDLKVKGQNVCISASFWKRLKEEMTHLYIASCLNTLLSLVWFIFFEELKSLCWISILMIFFYIVSSFK